MDNSDNPAVVSLCATIGTNAEGNEGLFSALHTLIEGVRRAGCNNAVETARLTLTPPAHINRRHTNELIAGAKLAQGITGHPLFANVFGVGHPEIRATTFGDMLYVPVITRGSKREHSRVDDYILALRAAVTTQYKGEWVDRLCHEVLMYIPLIWFPNKIAPEGFSDWLHSYELPEGVTFKVGKLRVMSFDEGKWTPLKK